MNATPAAADALLRWNTANIFSSLSGDDYRQAFQQLETDLAVLERAFDADGVRRRVAAAGEPAAAPSTGPTDPNSPGPNSPGPNSPGPNSPGPNSPGPNSPGPNSPGPNSPGPNSPGPNSPGPNSPGPNSPGPNSPGPNSPGPNSPGPNSPGPNSPGPNSPGPNSPGPNSPGPNSPGPNSPGPNSPGPNSPGPNSPGPNSPGPNSPGPNSPGPNSPGPNSPGNDAPVDEQLANVLEQALDGLNRAARLAGTLEAFIYAFVSTDSYDALAARETSRLEVLETRRRQLEVRLQGWLGGLGPRLEGLIAARPGLTAHRFYLLDAVRRSRYLMSEELEQLAAELCLDGALAFGKLQGNLTSQLKAPLEREAPAASTPVAVALPITVVHNLCSDPDPAVRERAYRAEVAAWDTIRVPIAAALNAVKGSSLTLARRRGRESVLAEALDDNRIDGATLDALLGAIREAFPMFRRYLAAKARKLGLQRLRWWDLFAPVGAATRRFTWPEASELIARRFGGFSDELGRYAERAFAERWIDVEPRDGKRGGAFCMGVVGVEESRILLNFDGGYEQVSTLAHELGHGFHNHCQLGLEPLRRGAPMTLAETASTFCETLLAEAMLAGAAGAELGAADRLAILESQLCGSTQVCLDISSRFQFESAVLERRAGGELSPDELCELMRAAQSDTYADAVEPETYHPYMWLWKQHYYHHTANFYNFPYAFGQLFALGLYAIYRREGASFAPRYRQLLRSTGEESAAPLAARFGIDITGRDFWRASLALIGQQVERYEAIGADR